eukprot:147472_1
MDFRVIKNILNPLNQMWKTINSKKSDETTIKFGDKSEEQRNECIVSGFSKQILSKHHTIPLDIIKLIAYYFRDVDIWDKTTTHPCININDNLIKTGNIGWPYRMTFGTDNISSPKIKKWYLSIPKDDSLPTKHNGTVPVWSVIGIIPSSNVSLNIIGNFYNQQNNGYGLKGWDGAIFHGGNKPIFGSKHKSKVTRLCKGDNIIMILNMKQATLGYIINGKSYGISFDVNPIQSYRLCVALCKDSQMILHK